MTRADAEQEIRNRLDGITQVVAQFIRDEMVGMDSRQLLKFDSEVTRATKELQPQIAVQNERLCFWLRRILSAKESTRGE